MNKDSHVLVQSETEVYGEPVTIESTKRPRDYSRSFIYVHLT
ncbi:hypothetical protein ACPWSR_04925 [Alloiococcus sp. CFN-8]